MRIDTNKRSPANDNSHVERRDRYDSEMNGKKFYWVYISIEY